MNSFKNFLAVLLNMGLTLILSLPLWAANQAPPASDYDQSADRTFTNDPKFPFRVRQTETPPTALLSAEKDIKIRFDFSEDGRSIVSLQYDISKFLDWTALQDLNHLADEAWSDLLSCNGGNSEKSVAQYRSGSFCKAAVQKMKNFTQSVALFLSSTMVQEMDPSKTLQCNGKIPCQWLAANSPYRMHRNDHDYKLLLGYNLAREKDLEKNSVGFGLKSILRSCLDALPGQTYHPLLIQTLLEHLAAGYPIHYGTYTSGGARRALDFIFGQSRQPIILDSADIDWSIRGYTPNVVEDDKRESRFNWVQALTNDRELPVITESEDQDGSLTRLRRGLTALRLLTHMSVGHLEFSDWGFWPDASHHLLGVLAQAEYHYKTTNFWSPSLSVLAMRLSHAGDRGIPYMTIIPGSMNSTHGPEAAAFVGAWRKLYNRH